jgi:uroporphyrin-III C-methyltransferase
MFIKIMQMVVRLRCKRQVLGGGPLRERQSLSCVDLLTLAAARILANADVVLYDALVTSDILDLAPNARKVGVGKRGGRASTDQAFINRLLVASARNNEIVVRLKGGDPMIFGRAQEEIDACTAAGIRVEIIPGVTAASAAAAQLGVSLTQRGLARSVVFVTPSPAADSRHDDSWADAIVTGQSSAIYMGVGQSARIQAVLVARGLSGTTPIVLVHDVGRPQAGHKATNLFNLVDDANDCGDEPVIILVGEVFAKCTALKNHEIKLSMVAT